MILEKKEGNVVNIFWQNFYFSLISYLFEVEKNEVNCLVAYFCAGIVSPDCFARLHRTQLLDGGLSVEERTLMFMEAYERAIKGASRKRPYFELHGFVSGP